MDRDIEREVQAEASRITQDPAWKARRTTIRAARIIAGVVFAVAALWVAEPVSEVVSKPIATLSLADLGVFALRLGGAFWLIASGWWAAFGEGPDRDDLRAAAIESLRERGLLSDTAAPVPKSEAPPTPPDAFLGRGSKAKAPVVGTECKKCGATYVSAKYCPKCRLSLK